MATRFELGGACLLWWRSDSWDTAGRWTRISRTPNHCLQYPHGALLFVGADQLPFGGPAMLEDQLNDLGTGYGLSAVRAIAVVLVPFRSRLIVHDPIVTRLLLSASEKIPPEKRTKSAQIRRQFGALQ